MTGKMFINYRRDDDLGYTQALYQRLENRFVPDDLFMDIDNIPAGQGHELDRLHPGTSRSGVA
jgi:hypothetical protein